VILVGFFALHPDRISGNLSVQYAVQRLPDKTNQTSEQVLSLAPIDDKPIAMLINKPKSATAVGVDFGAYNKDQKTRELVGGMYPKAKRIVVDLDHQVQRQAPVLVVDAIRTIIAMPARGG